MVNFATNHCVIHAKKRLLSLHSGPPTLYLGSSHITRLQQYATNQIKSPRVRSRFERAMYLGVGGTGWRKCRKHFRGEGLSKRQQHLGNQCQDLVSLVTKPKYCVIALGSNDVDLFHRRLVNVHIRALSHESYKDRAESLLKTEYEELRDIICDVLQEFVDTMPETSFLYIKILPRPWWGTYARRLAKWLDYLVLCGLRKRFKIREIWARELYTQRKYMAGEHVHYGMLRTDVVHLNQYGYRALTSAIMRPLLHMWETEKMLAK